MKVYFALDDSQKHLKAINPCLKQGGVCLWFMREQTVQVVSFRSSFLLLSPLPTLASKAQRFVAVAAESPLHQQVKASKRETTRVVVECKAVRSRVERTQLKTQHNEELELELEASSVNAVHSLHFNCQTASAHCK